MEWLATAANRGSVVTGPYEIDNSLKLEDDNTENLYRNLNASTSTTKFTVSMWFKKTEFGGSMLLYHRGVAGNEGVFLRTSTESNDALQVDIGASGTNSRSYTTAKLRDPSAWYHVVLGVDTTQSTATDRFKLYLNGNLITSFTSRANPAQNFAMEVSSAKHRHGAYNDTEGHGGFCGYITDCHYVDGSQKQASDFGEFDDDSGIWIPKRYSGSHGTGGYFLDFTDASDLGANTKGDGVDFTLNNIAAINQATDTPQNNFCTINPLFDNNFAIFALSEGGTRGPNTGEGNGSVGTFAVDSGKWYWEGVTTAFSGTNYWKWGITRVDVAQGNSADPSTDANSTWYTGDNAYYTQTSTTASDVSYNTGFTGYTAGDIWSISLNCDVSPYTMTFRINNAVPGTANNNTDRSVGTYASADAVLPFFFLMNSSSDDTWHNFGNPFLAALSGGNSDANGYGDFKYAPPSGYYALCSKNLAEFG